VQHFASLEQTAVAPPLPGSVLQRRSSIWSGLIELDFSRPFPALLLGIAFILSRLPWVNMGYGEDPDAWRVAMSARYLIEHGSYLPSRLPGYPVHDIITAALLWGGWTLTNLATVAMSLAGVFCFARIIRRLSLPAGGLLTVSLAFAPLLWFTSAQTLDYSWALTLLLAAYLAVLNDRPIAAGVLLGLAGGCRITYLGFALPLALILLQGRRTLPPLRFLAAAIVTWLAVFAPVWLRYGPAFWDFYDVRPSWGDFLRALTEDSLGLLALIMIVVALLVSWRELRRLPAILRREPQTSAWAMIALLALLVFVRLPLQTYYLMPAVPFTLLLLARVLRVRMLAIICVALLLGGFVDIYTTSPSGWRSPTALLHIRPAPGLVMRDYQLRRDRLALVRQVLDLPLPPHAVLTTGFYFPMVMELHRQQLSLTLPEGYLQQIGPLTDNARGADARDRTYVWLLRQGEARRFLIQGYELYTLDFSRQSGRPAQVRIYRLENERFGLH
jgi:hypothetical protein